MESRADLSIAPLTITEADRSRPDAAFVERMRSMFPVEKETDAMFTRKMLRRTSSAYAPVDLAKMSGYLTGFLKHFVEGPFQISGQRWFAGGASKIQMGFTLEWNAPGRGPSVDRMVIRMEPTESINSTSRRREHQLLKAFAGVVPVPQTFWVDADAQWFPEPAVIYAFCDGITKPRAATSGQVSGIGTNFGSQLRQKLGAQFVDRLARIHSFDFSRADLSAFELPALGTTESASKQLGRARRTWEEDRIDDMPLLEVAANWLERNLPTLDVVSVVHGDYRSGNFLYDEHSLEFTGILDWERGYLGDRHRDLAWTTHQAFGHLDEDGRTFLVCGLVPIDEFLETYQRLSGLTVDPVRLRYYRVLASYQIVISATASVCRVVKLARSHQDILIACAEPVGYLAAEQLRQMLEEVI